MKSLLVCVISLAFLSVLLTGCKKEEDQPDFDGSWRAVTTESSAEISSSSVTFTIVGTGVNDISWRVHHDVGLFFGQGWSSTLSSDNSFSISPTVGNTTVNYTITLNSSSSGSGTFTFDGEDLQMTATKN